MREGVYTSSLSVDLGVHLERTQMMGCLISVLVFQQVDDLADHDQNRAQTHLLTSIPDLVGVQ